MKPIAICLSALILALSSSFAAAQRPRESRTPVPTVTPIPGKAFLHAGPLVGHVTESTARLWAKASNQSALSFKIGEAEDLTDGRLIEGPALQSDTSFTGQVDLKGLKPSTRYYYAPQLDGDAALPRPIRRLLLRHHPTREVGCASRSAPA
jgi:alkaline phosphatase D